mgnify:CR=1 FL=1
MPGGIDNRNTEDKTLKKRIEFIERNLENTRNDVIDTKNTLDTLKKMMTNLEKLIDSRVEIFMSTSKRNDFSITVPNNLENNEVEKKEEIKEKKLDISKFIEEFSQEFNFIKKDEFNEEMENGEIMGKIIEFVKRMLGIKNDEINLKTNNIIIIRGPKNTGKTLILFHFVKHQYIYIEYFVHLKIFLSFYIEHILVVQIL